MKSKLTLARNISTLFLRSALIGMGGIVILLCILVLPSIHANWSREFPEMTIARYPLLVGLIITALFFFAALLQSMKLLNYIDSNAAFSKKSVRALRGIKYCAVAIASLYVCGLPIVYHIAQAEDAPGLILIFGTIFIGIPVVIAVFTGLVQVLLSSVIEIKSENDLTI